MFKVSPNYVKTCRFPGKLVMSRTIFVALSVPSISGHIVLSNIKPRAFNGIMPYLHFVLKT